MILEACSMRIATVYRRDDYDDDHRTFVVLGAPRGGTSLMAGAIQLLGVPMGAGRGVQHEDPAFNPSQRVEQMIQTICERNDAFKKWGWKRPNTVYFYPDIAKVLRNPVFIFVIRNPLDIMLSACKHDRDILHQGHFRAPFGHYQKTARLVIEYSEIPTYLLKFESCVEKPSDCIADLIELLGVEPTIGQIERCKSFIDPSTGYQRLS